MLNVPFAFLAPESGFDPTLGGTIEPYFWYDFTDFSTMTEQSGKITEINSKGSNTGSIARGSGFTKYNAANTAGPIYDSTNKWTVFSGSATTNSVLARRYGTGDSLADEGASSTSNSTTVIFIEPNWGELGGTTWRQLVSWKGESGTTVDQPEEWSIIALSNGDLYPGTTFYAANSPTTAKQSIASQKLPNTTVYFSFSGSGDISADNRGPWSSYQVRRFNSGGSYEAGQDTTNFYSYSGAVSNGSNGNHEGLVIGGRSRTDVIYGTTFRIRHFLFYDVELSDSQVESLITEYKNEYSSDNLNPNT